MTVKRIPSADSPGDFVGRGGLGAGGGRTYTGSTGGKSIVTGKKSSVSKKSKKKLKGEKKRDWSDVKLTDRREGLTEKFLDNHGYRHSDTAGKPNTYTYDGDKVKAYSAYVGKGGKDGVSVKTFNNPTLKSLRDWMGY
jgi:hypothetical protein